MQKHAADNKKATFRSLLYVHNCVAGEANARRIESFRAELTPVNEHES